MVVNGGFFCPGNYIPWNDPFNVIDAEKIIVLNAQECFLKHGSRGSVGDAMFLGQLLQ